MLDVMVEDIRVNRKRRLRNERQEFDGLINSDDDTKTRRYLTSRRKEDKSRKNAKKRKRRN
jgi:hypothetical protein